MLINLVYRQKRGLTERAGNFSVRDRAPSMIRRLILQFILVGTLFLSLPNVALAEPFAFRGILLGISLADFRKTQFPDEAKYPKSRVICSGDKEATKLLDLERPPIGADLTRIGAVACNFYSLMNGRLFRNGPDFANVGGYETTFFFSPATMPAPLRHKLYMVTITPRSNHYQTIVDALSAKYGKPANIATNKIKNRMGAEFIDETATWKNEASTIAVKKYNDNINQSILLYLLDVVVDAVNSATATLATENAKKL